MIVSYNVIQKLNEWLVERTVDRHGEQSVDYPFNGTLADCYAYIKLKEMGVM